jgi:hypothetical protein
MRFGHTLNRPYSYVPNTNVVVPQPAVQIDTAAPQLLQSTSTEKPYTVEAVVAPQLHYTSTTTEKPSTTTEAPLAPQIQYTTTTTTQKPSTTEAQVQITSSTKPPITSTVAQIDEKLPIRQTGEIFNIYFLYAI